MSAHPSRPSVWGVAGVVAVTVPTGYVATRMSLPITHDRYFPWIMGRTLGLAAYATMVSLVALGVWIRHPWRHRWPFAHPETRLRLHATLGVATCVLVGGHIAALASDAYAGVAWPNTLVPDASTYRPVAVTLGVLAVYFLIAITATAALGGRLVGRHWLIVHRLAAPTLLLVWLHGVLAGSDTLRLRTMYAVSGGLVALLMLSRAVLPPAAAAARPLVGARPVAPGTPIAPVVAAAAPVQVAPVGVAAPVPVARPAAAGMAAEELFVAAPAQVASADGVFVGGHGQVATLDATRRRTATKPTPR